MNDYNLHYFLVSILDLDSPDTLFLFRFCCSSLLSSCFFLVKNESKPFLRHFFKLRYYPITMSATAYKRKTPQKTLQKMPFTLSLTIL